ncbi:MAG: Xaa-Pro peptidase family protein [Clostridiales bacterium]|nr:Xaa-Pro peptidase family protein [Clostridiales bacterium]
MNTRISRVLQNMEACGLSQFLISDPKSIWYLTGVDVHPMERLFAFLVRKDGRHTLFLNNLFSVPETKFHEVWFSDTDDSIGRIAAEIDADAPLGIDKDWRAGFLIPLMSRCPGMRPVLASDCVDGCRAVKDEEEIAIMREASRINDEVNRLASEYVKPGMTEKQVAAYIDAEFQKRGCTGPSFNSIVSFGKNAADPHHGPDDTVLHEGECVLIDMGCVKDRYCSDMTRTFFCGEPDEEFVRVYNLVREANEKAEAIIRPGVRFCDIDAAARDHIAAAGFGEFFNHRLGHFIGQTDHEKGDVSSANTSVAVPGMIFSIEPGVYLEGRFGVRVEDLVLVTEDGCEVLNHEDKRLRMVG